MKYGVIDVGGGLRGIYGAGVLDRCLEEDLRFDLCIGVSAGSANVASFLAGQKGRNLKFYADYSFRNAYMSFRNLLRRGSYLDLDYIYGDALTNAGGEYPLDYQAMAARPETAKIVATDVASRGIDVDDVDAVFNFDVPEENEYYVHRIGRTGRAKRHGVAYTLLSDFPSRMRLDDIARNTRSQIVSAKLEEDGTVVPLEK